VALLGALLLIFVAFVRPQEFIPALEPLRLLNVATLLAAVGVAVEVGMGKQKLAGTPQLPWLLAFLVWSMGATILRLGVKGAFEVVWGMVGLSVIFMLVVTFAARSFTRFRWIGILLVAIGIGISGICIHQGMQPLQCMELDISKGEKEGTDATPDGRSCDTAWICEREGGKSNATYLCEKYGLFNTFTQGGRVRWRGTLGDPNELSIMVGAMIPFLFAINATLKKKWFLLFMLPMLGVALWCVVLTGSRGGQLVILTIFGVYFVRRYGIKGVVVGAVLALPVLLLGGREGEEADASSAERAQLLYMGMDMLKSSPVTGVGTGQFVEHSYNYLTAHNAYLLVASEAGIVGGMLWMLLVYTSVKIPLQIARQPPALMDQRLQPFAVALATSFAGILIGIFFLSFAYKNMLFIYFGLSGALYGIVRQQDPTFRVTVKGSEIGKLAGAYIVLLMFIFVYSRLKGTG
jgi:hypothetical protein